MPAIRCARCYQRRSSFRRRLRCALSRAHRRALSAAARWASRLQRNMKKREASVLSIAVKFASIGSSLGIRISASVRRPKRTMQIFIVLVLLTASVSAVSKNAYSASRLEIVHPYDKRGDGLNEVMAAPIEAPLKPHADSQLLFVQAVSKRCDVSVDRLQLSPPLVGLETRRPQPWASFSDWTQSKTIHPSWTRRAHCRRHGAAFCSRPAPSKALWRPTSLHKIRIRYERGTRGGGGVAYFMLLFARACRSTCEAPTPTEL